MPLFEELKVFSGNANKRLATDICDYLGMPLGKAEVFKFSNDNTFVRILENVRQRDVFLVQSFSMPANDHVMELLIMIDACKRASAGRVTAVIPYYGYGRTDKKDQPRVPITARLLADLLTTAGADRVLTVDLHAGQIQGFFSIPVDELTALPLLTSYFKALELPHPVAVAVDIGISKRARDFAEKLAVPLAIVEKRRVAGNVDRTELLNIIGEVQGKTAILMDDEVDTAGSMVNAAKALLDAGVREVYGCCTHAVLSGPAAPRLLQSPIKELVTTDTVPVPPERRDGKVKVVSVAALLGEAIHRIHSGLSVGAMFDTN
ncbi:MAG: ribose-phosphate pyrophosphokinase [SAR202 cluster bacterium]|nr:ribose-phosphate pyrophosphokinase [SAR202 cluster bacterium]